MKSNDLAKRQILISCTLESTTKKAQWLWRVSFSVVFRTICPTSDVILNHCCLRRPSLSHHHCLHCKGIRSSLYPAFVFVIFNNPESLLRKAKPHPHLQFPTGTFGVKLFYFKFKNEISWMVVISTCVFKFKYEFLV